MTMAMIISIHLRARRHGVSSAGGGAAGRAVQISRLVRGTFFVCVCVHMHIHTHTHTHAHTHTQYKYRVLLEVHLFLNFFYHQQILYIGFQKYREMFQNLALQSFKMI